MLDCVYRLHTLTLLGPTHNLCMLCMLLIHYTRGTFTRFFQVARTQPTVRSCSSIVTFGMRTRTVSSTQQIHTGMPLCCQFSQRKHSQMEVNRGQWSQLCGEFCHSLPVFNKPYIPACAVLVVVTSATMTFVIKDGLQQLYVDQYSLPACCNMPCRG